MPTPLLGVLTVLLLVKGNMYIQFRPHQGSCGRFIAGVTWSTIFAREQVNFDRL
jgi:hypothetical protein